jgi:hypothetical protein
VTIVLDPPSAIFVAVLGLLALGLFVAFFRDRGEQRDSAKAALDDLLVLDPTLLEVFGRDSWGYGRYLDRDRIHELAETKRRVDHRDTGRAALDLALSDLSRARKDSE